MRRVRTCRIHESERTMPATSEVTDFQTAEDVQVLESIVRHKPWSGAHAAATHHDTDELLLIDRAVAGDERAFAELVTRYQTAVYNLAYRMLGDAGEAEDAAQEVFLRIYRRLATYDQDHRFSTWVLSIASHYCIDLLRRKRPW